jgi:hypothetical protein
MMNKSKSKSNLRPEISRELDRIKFDSEQAERIRRERWPKESKSLEYHLKAKIREVENKILKDHDYDKLRKAVKKIGGVRGKFHPSLERTRKRT